MVESAIDIGIQILKIHPSILFISKTEPTPNSGSSSSTSSNLYNHHRREPGGTRCEPELQFCRTNGPNIIRGFLVRDTIHSSTEHRSVVMSKLREEGQEHASNSSKGVPHLGPMLRFLGAASVRITIHPALLMLRSAAVFLHGVHRDKACWTLVRGTLDLWVATLLTEKCLPRTARACRSTTDPILPRNCHRPESELPPRCLGRQMEQQG